MNTKEKMIDFEEMARMMAEYQKADPIGCAELCGRLVQADADAKRISQLQQQIAALESKLNENKAG